MRNGALVAALLWAATADAQTQNASGALVLDGESTPLRYAYASAEPGAFDKSKDDVRVLLSDVPLSDDDRKDVFALSRLGRRGTAHVVEVTIDADGDPIAGAIYAPQFNGMLSLTGMHRFERTRFERSGIAGELHTRAPGEIAGVSYEYASTFSATIPRPPSAAEVATSLTTPAGIVAARYLEALKRGQLETFRAALSASAAAAFAGADGATRFAELRREMPTSAKVVLVTLTSDVTAVATIEGRAGGVAIEYQLSMTTDGSRWTVSK